MFPRYSAHSALLLRSPLPFISDLLPAQSASESGPSFSTHARPRATRQTTTPARPPLSSGSGTGGSSGSTIDATTTMGFPVGGYSTEMLLPRVLLQVLLLLGHLHRFLLWAFHAVGLGDLIDLGCNYPYPPPPTSTSAAPQEHHHPHPHGDAPLLLQHRRPEFRTVPAVLVDEALPVVRFDELAGTACGDGDCAVCLSGIGGADEVRRLSNCRHAFHRACLDRWMAHDQRTCPLCRAPLIPGLGTAPAADPWAVAAPWHDAADYDMLSYAASSLPSTPLPTTLPTPTLLRPHELLLTGLGGFQ